MADIFVSYSNSDRVHARTLAEVFEHQGWSVWWDREIPIGRVWAEVIEEEITQARSVLVLWSPMSVASDWVKNEARDANARHILIPALIESTKLPMEFRHIQTADLTAWKPGEPNAEFDKLLRRLHLLLDESRAPQSSRGAEFAGAPSSGQAAPSSATLGGRTDTLDKQPIPTSSKPDETRPPDRDPLPTAVPHRKRAERKKPAPDYSDRIGAFAGTAHTTTHNLRGEGLLEISNIENSGRTVSGRFKLSGPVRAEGTLAGTIDEKYHLKLVGTVSSLQQGSLTCTLTYRFVDSDQIHGEYLLEPNFPFSLWGVSQNGELLLKRAPGTRAIPQSPS